MIADFSFFATPWVMYDVGVKAPKIIIKTKDDREIAKITADPELSGAPYWYALADAARKMTAAPEMEAALLDLLDVCRKLLPSNHPAVENAESALSKSTGRHHAK